MRVTTAIRNVLHTRIDGYDIKLRSTSTKFPGAQVFVASIQSAMCAVPNCSRADTTLKILKFPHLVLSVNMSCYLKDFEGSVDPDILFVMFCCITALM